MQVKKINFKNTNSNFIHPTAVIDSTVTLGIGNYIGPYCVIGPNVKVGNNNRFEAFCSIGSAPEHKLFWNSMYKSVIIGNSCCFREFVTINAGTTLNTVLQNDIIMLSGSHVGHDSVVENKVTISRSVVLAGHCYICEGANIGLGAMLHQFSIIGHYAMIGMGAIITKKTIVEPLNVYAGNPAKFIKKNEIGMKIHNINTSQILLLQNNYLKIRSERKNDSSPNMHK